MQPTQEPPPPTRSGRPRRSENDRYLGGVAGGIAERLGIDPAFVRMGLVGATLYLAYADGGDLHPLVLVPYALSWAVLPTASAKPLVARLGDRDARRELVLAIIVVVLGLVILARPGSILVLALAGLAAALLRDPAPTATPGAPPPESEAETTVTGQTWSPWHLVARRTPVFRPQRARREPALWPLTVGLLVLVFTVALAMDQATSGRVDPRIVVDVALLVVGGVLLLSAWRGRATINLFVLVALLPLWIATSVADVGRFSGEGTVRARPDAIPTTVEGGLGPVLSYEVGYGRLDLDLRALPLRPGDTVTVEVGVTGGRADIMVPADATIRVRGDIGFGTIDVSAPSRFLSDADAAVNRAIDRSYPALGTECYQSTVSEEELAHLAASAGIDVAATAAGPPDPEEVVSAIDAAGYPRPIVSHVDRIDDTSPDDVDGMLYDEFGNPVTTTSVDQSETSTITYWNIEVAIGELELCRPTPPPADPATIVLEPTIGLGTLEIQRV